MSIIHGDCIEYMKSLNNDEAQIIICDPPYNIGKDFGNNKYKMNNKEYLHWCSTWIMQCLRILKPNGTMFIYGLSETLSQIVGILPEDINKKWLIWHYTNKTIPTLNFWQPSHESILVLWKSSKVFNRDLVRVKYTDSYIKANGKKRAPTIGRFSDGSKETTYNVNPLGALPRDVIKIGTLAGSNKERVEHPTQKPINLCETLINSCKQRDGYVLIPFAGSGSECVVCKKLGIEFIAIEINIDYIGIIKNRLDNIQCTDKMEIYNSINWENLSSFKNIKLKKTQYEYYLENGSTPQVLSIVNFTSKVFGTVCEKMIIEMLNLGPRTSTQNDATYKNKKIEIKVARYKPDTYDCMWQHIEPDNDYDIILFCVLTFVGFDIYYISKQRVLELIKENVIKKQGKQGHIAYKKNIQKYLSNNLNEILS